MGYTREKILSALQQAKALGVLLSLLVWGFLWEATRSMGWKRHRSLGSRAITEIGGAAVVQFGFYAIAFLIDQDPWGKYLEQAIARELK